MLVLAVLLGKLLRKATYSEKECVEIKVIIVLLFGVFVDAGNANAASRKSSSWREGKRSQICELSWLDVGVCTL